MNEIKRFADKKDIITVAEELQQINAAILADYDAAIAALEALPIPLAEIRQLQAAYRQARGLFEPHLNNIAAHVEKLSHRVSKTQKA